MTLIFENQGTLDPFLITTLGVNIKESASPIGFFGTGLKYAIAAALRLGIEIEIRSGGNAYAFAKQPHETRGRKFDVAVMMTDTERSDMSEAFTHPQVQALGFTVDMGRTWEPWMIYRELYSNMLDEDGHLYESEGDVEPDAGLTRVIVKGLDDVHARRSEWFLGEERKLLSETPACQVYDGASTCVFYHGIRVLELERPGTFTYNIVGHLDLTEDRTVKHRFFVDANIRDAITRMCDKALIERVIRAPAGSVEGRLDYDDAIFTASHVSDAFVEAVADASRSTEPFNKSALTLAHKKARETFLPKPRPPNDRERAALKTAFTALARVGVQVSPVVVVDGVAGDGFASTGKIWLTAKSFDTHLASRLLEIQLNLDMPSDREGWLIRRLLDTSDRLGAAMAGAVVTLPDAADVEVL